MVMESVRNLQMSDNESGSSLHSNRLQSLYLSFCSPTNCISSKPGKVEVVKAVNRKRRLPDQDWTPPLVGRYHQILHFLLNIH